jgi:hypothetical protein
MAGRTPLAVCNAVTARFCDASIREPGDGVQLLSCYRCGTGVCRFCSSMQVGLVVGANQMTRRRLRICDLCLAHEPQGEARVLLRRYHEADYPETTLADCEAEIAAQRAYLGYPAGALTSAPR